jgi:hypothetical protein
MSKKVLLAIALFVAAAYVFAADPKMIKITPELAKAKTVFIYDHADLCPKTCAEEAKSQMDKWEHYTVVDTPEKADLVFTFTTSVKVSEGANTTGGLPGMAAGGGDTIVARYTVYLTVYDTKTHTQVYQDYMLREQPWSKPAQELIKEMQRRVDKAKK